MKRAVGFYSPQPLPWNSLVSGPLEVEGSLAGRGDFRIRANLMLAPVSQGAPVRGQIAAAYDSATGALDLGRSTVILPASRAEFSGAVGQQLQVHLESRDLNDFLPVLGESAGAFPLRLENGSVVFDGTVTGRADRPLIDGHVSLAHFSYSGRLFDSLAADLHGSPRDARLENATLVKGSLRARLQFAVSLDNWRVNNLSAISGSGAISGSALPDVASLIGRNPLAASGTVNAAGEIAGTVGSPRLQANLEITKGAVDGEPFDRFAARLSYAGRTLQVAAGRFTAGAKQVLLDASFEHTPAGFQEGRLRFDVRSNVMPLDQIATLDRNRPGVQGSLQLTASGAADLMLVRGAEAFRLAAFQADVTGRGLQLTGQALGDAHLTAHSQGTALHVDLVSNFADSDIRGQGDWRLEGDYPGTATLTFAKLDLVQLRRWITPGKANGPARFIGSAAGELRLGGPALKPELLSGELRLPTFSIGPAPGSEVLPGAVPFALKNSGPIVATFANSALTVQSARLVGRSTDVTVSGRMLFRQKDPLDLKINGRLDLGVLQDFRPQIKSSGAVSVDATIRGALDNPDVNGRVELKNAALDYGDFPNGIENANGVIAFAGDRATIQTLSAETGGGKIRFFGFAGYSGGDLVFRLHANADAVRIRYPAGVSTQVNASLNFSGTPERSQVAGTVTVLRTSLNLQSDFSSLLAQSAQPVRVPSSSTGFPGGMNFDIQIQTAPDIQFESSLTQDLEADANLRLSGTVTNPALLGRINFTQGQVVFFGTKYTINQGSISFFNPVKIDPILNVDLETRARGIDITLSVTGPLNKLNMTPRSDPPLQFNEIVSLLATGQTPSEQTLRGQQSYTPQPFQQSAASALLGQAIASPVSGRLQRFFGISKVRIDPTLPGVEYNPQARLTIQQQVTPDVTFTYITNVTSANPQVVSMEWAVNKKWSVVAQREENGMLGLDFFYKRQFK
ncbi:MAG TPA: translocation/assembly module TamB domain-containing protein [Bryobacteraceae bacterium]|nr:translocation/assembly module TamB domain-containing protein [Bryobacteraceae bacterium]